MGTLAPHLSQRADIPHLTAITPVRLEFRVITRLCCSWRKLSSDAPSTNASAVPNLLRKKKNGYGAVAVVVVVVLVGLDAMSRRREIRPLDKADMVSQTIPEAASLWWWFQTSEREREEKSSDRGG